MHFKLISALSFVALVSAQCNTGSLQCCQTVEPANSAGMSILLGLVGVVLQDLTILVGLSCSPISTISTGGSSCDEQPVCCQNIYSAGLLAVGCTPFNG